MINDNLLILDKDDNEPDIKYYYYEGKPYTGYSFYIINLTPKPIYCICYYEKGTYISTKNVSVLPETNPLAKALYE